MKIMQESMQDSPDPGQKGVGDSQELSSTVKRVNRPLQTQNSLPIKVIPAHQFKDYRVLSPDKEFLSTAPRRESPSLNVMRKSATGSVERERAVNYSGHSS